MMKPGDERVKQVTIAAAILMVLTLLVCGVLIGWRFLPGLLGEWIGTMVGVMTTPVFLEISFVVIGLTIVMAINHWQQVRDGDELVYLERVEDDAADGGLPEQAKWAVYQEEPLMGEEPGLLEQAEGAVEIGDFEQTAELIAQMTGEDLKRPQTLKLRMRLARATGREDLARQLERELLCLRGR